MKLRNIIKNTKGFSLIEGVLVTLLLGIGMTGSLMAMQNTTLHNLNTDRKSCAVFLGHEKIEEIISDKAAYGFDAIQNSNYPTENLSEPYIGFTREVTITDVSETDLNNPMNENESSGQSLKRIDVTVLWGDKSYQQYTESTLLMDSGT